MSSAIPSALDSVSASSTGVHTAEDADVHASSDEYAARFGDLVGQWKLAVQERVLISMLDEDSTSVLDVGGGHGQIAVPLSQAHRSVTVLGSSPVCAERLRPHIETGMISFKSGNLIDIPFDARSFDLAVTFRLLSHCTAWKTLIAELCRIADHAVILDFPVWLSVNILNPIFFKFKRRIEGNTRTFRVFSVSEVSAEFRRHGFRLDTLEKQFFLPMALHRGLKQLEVSRKLEGLASTVGVTRLVGSPVIAKFVRE